MKKKILSVMMGVFLLSCLCSCGGTSEPSTADTTIQSSAETAENSELSSAEDSSEADGSDEASASDEELTGESAAEEESAENPYSLKKLYSEHGMKTGTCLTTKMITNTKMNQLILDQFDSVTMENAMKPDYLFNKEESIATGDLVVEFSDDVIQMLDWAKENDMAVRGHTLVWHSQTPSWIFHEEFNLKKPFVSREVMLGRLESYIKQVFENLDKLGYTDLFYAYDVVNEAWMEDGTMRLSDWKKTIGDDYLWQAFYLADKYAPESIDLYYNDYNEQFKEDTLVDFVNTLVDENGRFLIDGIGLQAHLYTSDSLEEYFEAIDKLAATGLKLEITELDVSLGAYQKNLPATDDNLKLQGQFYYNLVNGIFDRVDAGTLKMDSLTFWGFADYLSWRKAASPLLYDQTFQPKYSYYGAVQEKTLAGFDE